METTARDGDAWYRRPHRACSGTVNVGSATEIIAEADALEPAARLILSGRLVAVPTETVYGLAGDATDGGALREIYAAKARPVFNPLLVHVSSLDMAATLATFDPLSLRLARSFWPGPLTLVLPLEPGSPVHPLATSGLRTVALRHPKGFAHLLIERVGRPLAAPSANPSGRLSPTTADAVTSGLAGRIPLVVDGGPTPVGVESTIVRVTDGALHLLRPGGVTAERIEEATGVRPVRDPGGKAAAVAPGMLEAHYAPQAPVRLNAADVGPEEALLAFGGSRVRGAGRAVAVENLSREGRLDEAASRLFACLHALDRLSPCGIAVEPVPSGGLGEAINDRLRRAAAGSRPGNVRGTVEGGGSSR